MDIIQRVQVLIGGDSSQAKKVIKEVEQELRASQNRQRSTAARSGKDAADAFGREFNRAQDRWLRAAEGALRQYGGRVGGIIGNLISQYDRFGKAFQSSAALRGTTGAVGTAAGTAAGSFVGNAGAVATGVKVGSMDLQQKFKRSYLGLDYAKVRRDFARAERSNDAATKAKNLELSFERKISGQQRLRELQTRAERDTREEIAKLKKGGISNIDEESILEQNKARYQLKDQMALGKLQERTQARKYESSIANKRFEERSDLFTKKAKSPLGKLATGQLPFIGGLKGIAVVGGIVSGIVAATAATALLIKKLSELRDIRLEKEVKVINAEELIKEIESISDPVERAKKIIEEFGTEGGGAFYEFKKSTEELRKELDELPGSFRQLMEFGKFAWMGISETAKEFLDQRLLPITTSLKIAASLFGRLTGFSPEFVKEMAESEAAVVAAEKKLKDKKAEKVKETVRTAEEEARAKKEYDELVERETLENASYEQKKEMLQTQIQSLEATYNQNRSMKNLLALEKKRVELLDVQKKREEELTKEYEKQKDLHAKREDASRYSISDLANTNSSAGNAAKTVQSLEEQAKQARLTGNHALAEKLLNRSNIIRSQLGAAGITQSSEFGEEFAVADTTPLTAAQRFEAAQSEQNRLIENSFLSQGAVSKFGDRLGGNYGQLKEIALKRIAEQQSGRKEFKTMDQFFAEHGFMPVQPRNGR